MNERANGPLSGYRVLEIGSSVAGPFCGRLLADFGAAVIKIEPPEGDAVRTMSKRINGRSLYAASIFRNKDLVAVDLRTDEGRDVLKRLAANCDVVVENFRPGVMEKWGLGYEQLAAGNPKLVMVRISGYGQTGPYRNRAGYGVIGEAMSGMRHITGDPDRPPARINASVTDEITGLYAAFGAVMALVECLRSGRGQVIDAALYECAFSLIEPHVPAYSNLGIVAERASSRLPDSTPNNLYPTRDGKHIHITAMADGLFVRLARAMGRPELLDDARFNTAVKRSEHYELVDAAIGAWTSCLDLAGIEALLNDAGVPATRIYDMRDIFVDPHYRTREMLVELQDPELGAVTVAGVVPKMSGTPGRIRKCGARQGTDTRAVLRSVGGYSDAQIDDLVARSVVHCEEGR